MSKKILLIYTGGTIGMAQNLKTGALEPLDFGQLSSAIPELNLLQCHLNTISIAEPIDSSDMTPAIWLSLVDSIANNYALYDGFVILHGSDTMAYTASALSFLFQNLAKPVILTGSQLPIGILRSDARENLISSIELAILSRQDGTPLVNEVAIYFEYKLYRGNRTFKNSSSNFQAFQSPIYPCLAEMGVEMNINYSALLPATAEPFKYYKKLEEAVAILPLFPGFNHNLIYKIVEVGTRGLLLRTFGAGNAPQSRAFLQALREVVDQGIPVINISQCRVGAVNQSKYAAGRNLQEVGVISGHDMTLEAAVTKLMFVLAHAKTASNITEWMTKSLRGELTEAPVVAI